MGRIRKYMRGTAEELEAVREQTRDGLYDLDNSEIRWRNKSELLARNGYRLRPRFSPGWSPSWEGTDLLPDFCEDSLRALTTSAMDAIRISDEKQVMIKKTRSLSAEVEILRFLAPFAEDPSNHCVPVLDIFADDEDSNVDYIVMPLLREFYDPPFATVSEVVDFVSQTLTGLGFLHRTGVAHLDCSANNIMMDASMMYPKGFHPSSKFRSRDALSDAKFISRSSAKSVKYLFIDFEMSRVVSTGIDRRMRIKQGPRTLAPEIESGQLYDPFPADVYYLGIVYNEHLLKRYTNIEFIRPLIESMIQDDPNLRPTADLALAQLSDVSRSLKASSLRWRLCSRKERRWSKIWGDVKAGVKEALYLASTILRLPFRVIRLLSLTLNRDRKIALPGVDNIQ